MKRILLASLLFTLSAAQAAGPQFATPPLPASVRTVPNFMAATPSPVRSAAAIALVPFVPPVVKPAPALVSGTLGPPLPRSFSGARVQTVIAPGGPAAPVPVFAGSIQLPVFPPSGFPPSAGALINIGPREAHLGVFLDLGKRQ